MDSHKPIFFLLLLFFIFSSCKDNDPGNKNGNGNEGGNNDGSPLTYQVFSEPEDKTSIHITYREGEELLFVEVVESGWSKTVTLPEGMISTISANAVLNDEYKSSGIVVTTKAQIIQNDIIVAKTEGKNLHLTY